MTKLQKSTLSKKVPVKVRELETGFLQNSHHIKSCFEIIKFFFDTLHENTIKTQKKLGFIWLFIVSLKIHLITIDESIDKRTVMLSFLSINYFVKLSFVRSFHRYPLVLTISPPLYRDQRWLENKCYISLPFT